ncbi:TIGR01777 family oxidoreductase [Arachnia rubra]|uniref:TIGR01777 family oxidoreductase n=1 Tax=Arachnia rubra TaxID=1547448 RepID=A0ABX7Y3D8_9ACTN|nr:TIGR01777 family oxidoreductase [Arachnia rubra]QUC07689.1 TIGR01777 family oxidoreductase [Arachnia rubra]BCR81999.1 hypothetical protein SK1NUM_24420 [Arachnia rubra]
MTPRRVVISGASGLIGSALECSLRADGIAITKLVRTQPRNADEIPWDPARGVLDPDALAGAEAVVNLNGASIGKLPWTAAYRRTLHESRIQPTRTIAAAITWLGRHAPMLVSASAVGFYGHRPSERLREDSGAGDTFLANLCAAWEAEALKACPYTDVALIRTAALLHPQAVLKPMMSLTRWFLGGPLDSGRQQWPWLSLEDEVRAIRHVIDHRLRGPVNLSGPTPASGANIGRALAKRLNRPYVLPTPAPALRLLLGRDAADSLLLADAHVEPAVLLESGFTFTHPTAEAAIEAALPSSSRPTSPS